MITLFNIFIEMQNLDSPNYFQERSEKKNTKYSHMQRRDMKYHSCFMINNDKLIKYFLYLVCAYDVWYLIGKPGRRI